MKSVSKSQQRLMGMVHTYQKHGGKASLEVKKIAASMDPEDADDFASTKHKGLPEKKEEHHFPSFKEWLHKKTCSCGGHCGKC
jgi:hypothetical protein